MTQKNGFCSLFTQKVDNPNQKKKKRTKPLRQSALLGISNNQKRPLEEKISTSTPTSFLRCRNDRHHIEPSRNEIAHNSPLTEDDGWKGVGRVAKHQRLAARLAAHVSHFFRCVQHDELLVLGLDLRRYQAQALSRGVVQSLEAHAVQHERRSRETLLLRDLHDFPVQVVHRRKIQPVVGRYQQELRSAGLKTRNKLYMHRVNWKIIYNCQCLKRTSSRNRFLFKGRHKKQIFF